MNEQQFLEQYASEKVYFSSMHKYRALYKNEDLKIWCSGVSWATDTILAEETVLTVFNLDEFEFGFISENGDITGTNKTI